MREVDDALELMKDEFKSRMDSCEERRLVFEAKQAEKRAQVLRFEKFIQENDAKRKRADEKAKLEKKAYEIKCSELSALEVKISELEKVQRHLDVELSRKNCYRVYLDRVIEAGDLGFEEVVDILNRYSTLQESNRDLMQQVAQQEDEGQYL